MNTGLLKVWHLTALTILNRRYEIRLTPPPPVSIFFHKIPLFSGNGFPQFQLWLYANFTSATMSHLISYIFFIKKSNWLFVLTLFGCQKWGFTMEVENWLLLLENPDKAWVWSWLQLYFSCLAWPCPRPQVQCRPHKSHQQAVCQAGSSLPRRSRARMNMSRRLISVYPIWKSGGVYRRRPLSPSRTPWYQLKLLWTS